MKSKIITIAIIAIAAAMSGCGSAEKAETEVKAENPAVTTEATSEIPEGNFSELPDEEETDLNDISRISNEIFSDVKGKKMYGYIGEEEIITENGAVDCRVFKFYTYKSELYTEVATFAKDMNSADVYIYDSEAEKYVIVETEEQEISWHDTATVALAANAAK